MSTSKLNPKTSTSSVSKLKSTSTATTSKSSTGGASSSKPTSIATTSKSSTEGGASSSKSQAPPSVNPKEPVITSSTAAKPSKFYFACRNNEINVVTSLLPTLTLEEINQIEPNGSTALHAAAYYGNQEIVKLLLSKGTQRMIKNIHGATPYDEAKTKDIKKLFHRQNGDEEGSKDRFIGEKGPSFEWIFVDGDPSSYASFNRKSLLQCRSDEDFNRLCRGIQQYYISKDGPLANVAGIEQIRVFIGKAIQENDPTQVVRAYTAETHFYKRLNEDLSQLPTHWSGSKHERNIASIMLFHPVFKNYSFTGETYRGMAVSLEDLNMYVVGSVFMNKTFLSTSKEREKTGQFISSNKSSTKYGVVCKYRIKNAGTALSIEDMSEYSPEKEVLILPYASFKVKSIQKLNKEVGTITEMHVEEEDEVKWTKKKSYQTSQTHTSVNKSTSKGQDNEDDAYDKMFKDSQEKGKINPTDLAKWKKVGFGIDSTSDTYAKIWDDATKGKISKSDIAKWKSEGGIVTKGDDGDDSDLESYDGESHPNVFTASNQQSYATSKKFSSKTPFDMKQMMTKLENDSDD